MARITPSWSFDPTTIELDDQAEVASGIRLDLDQERCVTHIATGAWWVLPFASELGQETLGLRMVPGTGIAEWPVVRVREAEVMTLASRAKHFMPTRVFQLAMESEASWDDQASLATETWIQLEKLDAALGGAGNLEAVRKILTDAGIRKRVFGLDAQARCEALAVLDPTEETIRFREYQAAVVGNGGAIAPIPEVGCWNSAANAMAFVAAQRTADADTKRMAAWTLAQEPAGLDIFQHTRPILDPPPYGASSSKLALGLAVFVSTQPLATSPVDSLLHPAMVAVAQEAGEYRGDAHLVAAEKLVGVSTVVAFNALASAGYWYWSNVGDQFVKLFATAHDLSHEWPDVHEAMGSLALMAR